MKYLVLGGCPRSGTTMAAYILARHPSIAMTMDLNLARFFKAIDALFYRERELERLPERKKSEKERWTLQNARELSFSRSLKTQVVEAVYRLQFDTGLKELEYIGDKDPLYYDYLDTLTRELEPLFIIHITRNPFDVVNSMMRRTIYYRRGLDANWNDEFMQIETMCREWNRAFSFALELEEQNHRFLHLQYEDLVFDTNRAVERITNHLQICADFDFENERPVDEPDYHFTREHLTAGEFLKIRELIDIKGYRDYLGCSRSGLSSLDHLVPARDFSETSTSMAPSEHTRRSGTARPFADLPQTKPPSRHRFFGQFILRSIRSRAPRAAVILTEPQNHFLISLLEEEKILAGVFALADVKAQLRKGQEPASLESLSRLAGPALGIVATDSSATVAFELLRDLRRAYACPFVTFGDLCSEFELFERALLGLDPYHNVDLIAACHFGQAIIGPEQLYTTVPIRGKRILELGPMDTAMTGCILFREPKSLTAVESYWKNFLKCQAVKKSLTLDNLELALDDYHNITKDRYGDFDLIFAHGVLEHSHNPLQLCEQLSDLAPAFAVGVSSVPEGASVDKPLTFKWHGRKWLADSCPESTGTAGGPGRRRVYLSTNDWRSVFEELGFSVRPILHRDRPDGRWDFDHFVAVSDPGTG